MRIRHVFRQVKLSATKCGACSVCGKSATRSHTEFETLNPFNTNPDGSVKDANDIRESLQPKLAAWKLLPLTHARCES